LQKTPSSQGSSFGTWTQPAESAPSASGSHRSVVQGSASSSPRTELQVVDDALIVEAHAVVRHVNRDPPPSVVRKTTVRWPSA
jgi:hypothetical protein